jgi:hypothetical protein
MTSLIASGDIPPHFALDPGVRFGYHHFTLLFSAQLMRTGGLDPWLALDVARGLAMALSLLLAGLWTHRITRSRLAGALGGLVYALGMGTRWLLLLLPPGLINAISPAVTMMGSGLSSGSTLAQALGGPWQIEGAGPIPFPFAFSNGIFQAPVMNLGGTGQMWPVIAFLLLLTAARWKGKLAWVLTVILLAALGLLAEAGVVMSLAAWGLLAAWQVVRRRSLRLPASLWAWLSAAAVSTLIILFQGGVLSELFLSRLRGLGGSAGSSYFDFSFPFVFPPAAISAHLGSLSFGSPAQLLVLLAELGPVILVFPLAVIWGLKAARSGSWYQAAVALTGILGVGMFFFQYNGSAGISATTRIQWLPIGLCQTFAVPLVWLWAKKRPVGIQAAAVVLAGVMVFGGLVEFGLELVAIQRPLASTFIQSLDVKVMDENWNQLERDALIFDPNVSRAPTIFARWTNAYITWYSPKPEWEKLVQAPDPAALRAFGFSYAYIDRGYFEKLPPEFQQKLEGGCVKLVKEYGSSGGDYRRLLDLKDCQ